MTGTLLDLIDPVPIIEINPAGLSIQERFEQFHEANPVIYVRLCAMARELKARGHRKAGIKMLVEVLRWHYFLATTDHSSSWRINNDYPSRYARLIESQEPDLAGFFDTRELRS